ncbi:hypothetical protein CN074_25150 [Sinorhizobium medicae]|uniref:hypothetical protein n=1 Tax=Sinorhizobium medicae TaxID=110321 RepID=UPI000FDCC813|nr:hypothetical protein [Sinorhizobium medicae]RVH83132.1 hypothetical protein CN201_28350 [Sinorhizobium medicae]RVP63883.1 hypothetical protein CN074_25150 [Sinorhizobium medicae]
MEHTTTAVAASAVATPVWLPWLFSASEVAAVIAPILGVVWLLVQITSKSIEAYRKMRGDKA